MEHSTQSGWAGSDARHRTPRPDSELKRAYAEASRAQEIDRLRALGPLGLGRTLSIYSKRIGPKQAGP